MPWQPASLRSVLGGSLGPGVDRTALGRLVELAVTESDELDFKTGFYEFAHADAEERRKLRVEAAKDVAAFANHRGGVVLMGVKEERGQGTAAELVPIQVSDGQWRSLTQAVADVVSPPVAFERVFMPTEDDGSGIAALIVPPSPRRPHALVDRNTIRYPVRDHRETRWLAESEVSEWYRRRHSSESETSVRLDRVISDGLKQLVEGPWLWLACVPAQPVAWPINAATLRDDDLFSALGRLRPWYDVKLFDRPQRLVGPRRVKLAEHRDRDGRPEWAYAEIHSDGAVFVARDLSVTGTAGSSLELPDEYLTAVLTTEMRFVAACAQRVGAFGEAFLGGGITPGPALTMEIVDVYGAGSTTASGKAVNTGARTSMVGVDLDRTSLPAGWAIPAKLIGDELVQHYALAELRHLDSDGRLRTNDLSRSNRQAAMAWAIDLGLQVSEDASGVAFS